jgi:hypothetical protein
LTSTDANTFAVINLIYFSKSFAFSFFILTVSESSTTEAGAGTAEAVLV